MENNNNIDEWNISDLKNLFDISDDKVNIDLVNKNAARMIERAIHRNKEKTAIFLKEAKNKLISWVNHEDLDTEYNKQATGQLQNWRSNQYITQNNSVQSDKITDRREKTNIFQSGSNFQMKRQQLGVNQTHPISIVQGTINPNLKNTITRIISIDSQYRSNIYPYTNTDISLPSFNSDFTINLSDPLSNVLSIELNSIQIPKVWYNIDNFIGNNSLFLSINGGEPKLYALPAGDYNVTTIIPALNQLVPAILEFVYSEITRKITITNIGGDMIEIIFYMPGSVIDGCITTAYENNSLGWTLGYRETPNEIGKVSLVLDGGGSIEAESIINLYGPQYIMLVVDDFNHNRLNNAIISSVERDSKLELPEYRNVESVSCEDDGSSFFVKSAPRKLTQAQIYTLNSIVDDRRERKNRNYAPTTNDVLALIPITNEIDTIVRFGDDVNSSKREYFGPVSIDRFNIKLVDDKGNLIKLNGRDWSFTLKVTQLYQY